MHSFLLYKIIYLSSWRVYICHGFFSFLAGIVLTNDGNAILRELDVAHPAAKV
jgi:hypothetical protein